MSRGGAGDLPRTQRAAHEAAVKQMQEQSKKAEMELMVDPWIARGMPRPSDAPQLYSDATVGFGRVPLVNRIELAHYLTMAYQGLATVVQAIVDFVPGLAEHLKDSLENLAKLKDVAEQVAAEMDEGDDDA